MELTRYELFDLLNRPAPLALPGVDLSSENLNNMQFYKANLENANFSGSTLRCANFYGANLRGANMQDCDLRDANLHHVDFTGANLTGTIFSEGALDKMSIVGAVLETKPDENPAHALAS